MTSKKREAAFSKSLTTEEKASATSLSGEKVGFFGFGCSLRCHMTHSSVEAPSLTEDFIKDLVESWNVGDLPLVHPNFFIKNPHLLKQKPIMG